MIITWFAARCYYKLLVRLSCLHDEREWEKLAYVMYAPELQIPRKNDSIHIKVE